MTFTLMALFTAVFTSGLLGGIINYLIFSENIATKEVFEEKVIWYKDRLFYNSIFMGIAAAFVVPVFLQIVSIGVSENLISNFLRHGAGPINEPTEELVKAYSSLIVLCGICILVAISARPFLRSMSDKIIKKIEDKADHAEDTAMEAKRQTSEMQLGISRELEQRIETLFDQLNTKPQQDDEDDAGKDNTAESSNVSPESYFKLENPQGLGQFEPDVTDDQIMQALAKKPNTRRSIKGIRSEDVFDGKLDYATTKSRLYRLNAHGFVKKLPPMESGKLPRWKLDTKGWARVGI